MTLDVRSSLQFRVPWVTVRWLRIEKKGIERFEGSETCTEYNTLQPDEATSVVCQPFPLLT